MNVDHKEVTNGSRNGETLFVCAYLRPDRNKKPIRSLAPIEVKIMDNSTTSKPVYYSESHFRPIGKNGEVTSRVIPVFDNTGFRSRTGNPLNIFTTEKEAIECWNELAQKEIDDLEAYKSVVLGRIEDEINRLKDRMF